MTQRIPDLSKKDHSTNHHSGLVPEVNRCIILSEGIMGLSSESILEAEGLKAYSKSMGEEFEQEWENRKFKWLFKNKRKSKIKSRIYKKYRFKIFDIVNKICEIEIPIKIEETIEGFQYIDTIDKTMEVTKSVK